MTIEKSLNIAKSRSKENTHGRVVGLSAYAWDGIPTIGLRGSLSMGCPATLNFSSLAY